MGTHRARSSSPCSRMTVVRRHTRTDEEAGRARARRAPGVLGKRRRRSRRRAHRWPVVGVAAHRAAGRGRHRRRRAARRRLARLRRRRGPPSGIVFAAVTAWSRAADPERTRRCRHRGRRVIGVVLRAARRWATSPARDGAARSAGSRRSAGPARCGAYAGDRWWVLLVPLALARRRCSSAASPSGPPRPRCGHHPDAAGPPERAGLPARRRGAWPGACSAHAGRLGRRGARSSAWSLGSLVTNVDADGDARDPRLPREARRHGLDSSTSSSASSSRFAATGRLGATPSPRCSGSLGGGLGPRRGGAVDRDRPRRAWYASHVVIALVGLGRAAGLLMSVGRQRSRWASRRRPRRAPFSTARPGRARPGAGHRVVAGLAAALFGLARTAGHRGLGRRSCSSSSWASSATCSRCRSRSCASRRSRTRPAAPAEAITATPVLVLLAVALALVATGAALLQRRDVT